jgi:hypothetical protein
LAVSAVPARREIHDPEPHRAKSDGCRGVVELVRCLDGLDYRQAALVLAGYLLEPTPQLPPMPLATPDLGRFRPFTNTLSLDPDAPLLRAKQIAPASARFFEAGAWRGGGMLAGCVAAPVSARSDGCSQIHRALSPQSGRREDDPARAGRGGGRRTPLRGRSSAAPPRAERGPRPPASGASAAARAPTGGRVRAE